MRKFAIFGFFTFCLTVVLTLSVHAQEQKPSEPVKEESEDEVLRVETTLVTVPVRVKNQNGGYIPNLRAEDFRIFEDGVEQEIEIFETADKPFTVALVMDISDSTKIALRDIQNAAIAFLNQLKPADRAFIVAFDKRVMKLTEATNHRQVLSEAIRRVRTGGGTALYDTVETLINSYLKQIGGRKAIIILTDGIDTSSASATFESTIRLAAEQYALIYAIQFNPDNMLNQRAAALDSNLGPTIYTTPSGESIRSAFERGNRYLRLLSQTSGGRFYYADNLKNLERAFAQIADELRQLYSIGYYPKNQTLKKEKRRIKVIVNNAEGEVNTRESYIYKPESQ
jgi:VWFA-related protein